MSPMLRHPILALGLVALALSFATAFSPRASAAEQDKKAATEKSDRHSADTTLAEVEGAESGQAAGGEPDIMEPQPSLAIFTVIVFLGLLFVLGRFAWKPLIAA